MLINNKEGGYNYQERRHEDWDENYTLYRDKVIVDRLIQRQTVNLPLMKQTIRTLLKDVDDMPVLYFENLDNDEQAEIFKNEYWNYTVEKNNMTLQDIVDKKQVFLYGRSFDQWQIVDGEIKMTIQDPYDIYVDRYCDPTDIHSSKFLIHTHIYKTFADLEADESYDQKAVARLKEWYGTDAGLIKAADNNNSVQDKNKRMQDLGLDDVDSPVLGQTYVELTMHFVKRVEGDEPEQIWVYVEADEREILMKKKLEDIYGVTKDHFWRNHYPYNSWADDVERLDFWSDAVADIVRPSNKVLNAWFSQLVENRTLRNFGMHYYDSSIEGFVPGSYNPVPWGWYGVPGNPNDVIKKVDIPDLSESLDEMQFVIDMNQRATGATATQQGAEVDRQITLGEVQLALGEAKERIKGMSKFYTPAWKQRGLMFIKLIEGSADKLNAVKIYKQGRNTKKIYSREISPSDWKSKEGYRCRVWSQEEKNTRDTDALQKLNVAKSALPNNMKLTEVYNRKLLEFADLTPEEINAIMEEEQQRVEASQSVLGGPLGQGGLPQTPGQPVPNQPMPVQQQ